MSPRALNFGGGVGAGFTGVELSELSHPKLINDSNSVENNNLFISVSKWLHYTIGLAFSTIPARFARNFYITVKILFSLRILSFK